ncbi:TPA: hypothetical protein IAA68_08385 [Candidatus Galligastranaerophilus faecipullorum]|nr:hypothetical protein [Candidatus Galligastranaerophilus faecipullorum]
MAVVPDFLIKRVYKKGSLRSCDEGIEFDLKNVLGPGVICGLEYVQINDYKFTKDAIRFITQGVELFANSVSEVNPIRFRLGQEGTMRLMEQVECLKNGVNKIIIEFLNPEAGRMKITLEDNLNLA